MDSPDDATVVVVLTTVPDERTARTLAERLVDERLIACANILPRGTSVYRWEGAVRHEPEVVVIMKSTLDRIEALEVRVAKLHPYEVPEFLTLPAHSGSQAYVDWVVGEVAD